MATQTDESWPVEQRAMPYGRGVIQIWNARTRKPVTEPMTTREEQLRQVAISPTGERLAAGRGELWNTTTRATCSPTAWRWTTAIAATCSLRGMVDRWRWCSMRGSLGRALDYEIRVQRASDGQICTPPMINAHFEKPTGDFHPDGVILWPWPDRICGCGMRARA